MWWLCLWLDEEVLTTARGWATMGVFTLHNSAISEEQLKAFMEAVKADAGLQEKLNAAADADAVVGIAKEAGFVISADELQRAQAGTEVSEKDLEGISGGLRTNLTCGNFCNFVKYSAAWQHNANC